MADNNPHIIRSDQPLPLPPKDPPPAKPNGAARKANGHAAEAPGDDAAAQAEEFLAYWHGDVALRSSRPWTVQETIPEVGAGLLAGQWGTYKTFTAMDLACAVMSGTPIFGSEVDRRGGVLLYAAEGENEVQIRIQASIDNRCPELTKAAPFTWLTSENFTLNLLDSRSVEAFIARAQQIDAEMKKRFRLPLALVMIDTLVATAGLLNLEMRTTRF
jgi:AAA domain